MVTELLAPLDQTIFTTAAQSLDISGSDNAALAAAAVAARENDDDGRTEPARASTDPGAGSDTGM